MQSGKCKVSAGLHSIRVYNLTSDGAMPKIRFTGMSYNNSQFIHRICSYKRMWTFLFWNDLNQVIICTSNLNCSSFYFIKTFRVVGLSMIGLTSSKTFHLLDGKHGSSGYVSLSYRKGWYRMIPSTIPSSSTCALNSKLSAAVFIYNVCMSSFISLRLTIFGTFPFSNIEIWKKVDFP